jgi:chromosome segregation ATPase
MCKKLLFFGSGIIALGFLLFGGTAFMRVRQGVTWIRGQVEEQVPVEIELDRARQLIEETGPQIRECKRVIAERQVEIRDLESQISDLEVKNTKSREELRSQKSLLDQQQVSYVIKGRDVTRTSLESNAVRTLERVKTHDQILASKRERLSALEKSLAFAQKTLDNVLTQKANLESQLDLLETKVRQTEAMKAAASNINVDSTNLAKAKDILSQQSKRLEVVQQMIVNDRPLFDDLDLEESTSADVASEIANYLDGNRPAPKAEPLKIDVPASSCDGQK